MEIANLKENEMGLIIVERSFERPPTDADLDVVAERMKQCKEIRSITWKRSVLSRDRRRMICEFEAPDAETVRKVQLEAGAPFDRVWSAETHE
jgi:Protein of unknown function (DUF4242)